jgi:lysophospholipase L1-like esterase
MNRYGQGLILLILMVSGLAAGCHKPVDNTRERKGPIRVACIGASNTRGFQLPRLDENCYPGQLQTKLGEGYLVENFGVGGACVLKRGRMPYWKTLAIRQAVTFNPDIVIMDFGGNDTLPQDRREFMTSFIPDYVSLILKFRNLPARPRVYLVCPLAVYGNPSSEKANWYISRYVTVVAWLTGSETIDLFTPTKGDKTNFNYDQLHLSVKGCGIVADNVRNRILNP